MKKILISVIIILLLILSYFALAKGIGFLKIKSINNIKSVSANLDSNFNEANELSNKTYPTEVEALENAIQQLKISKQQYESKNLYNSEENSLGTIEIKTYKIHYLWTILGNYRKDRGVQSLTLDLKSTGTADVYDLQFTVVGTYTRITDFLYDIENDEQLNFEIENFSISSAKSTTQTNTTNNSANEEKSTNQQQNSNTNTQTSTNKQQNSENTEKQESNDGTILQAKFTVKHVGITLD